MTVFISGGAKCGKSSIAQDLAVKLSGGKVPQAERERFAAAHPEQEVRILRASIDEGSMEVKLP